MYTNNGNVSPHLLRPRRSYAEVIRDGGVNTARATGGDGNAVSNRTDDEGVASGIPRRGRRREGEARR
jgi:hypothetical protein